MNTWGPTVALAGVRVFYERSNPVTLNAGATSHRRCHLAHKKTPSRRILQYEHLGSYGGPRGGGVFLMTEVTLFPPQLFREHPSL